MKSRPWIQHYDYCVPPEIRYPRFPLTELLQIPAASFPGKAAIDFYGREISNYELRRLTLRFANALGKIGVRQGDRVGIQIPTSPQYVIAYFAVLSLGAIVVNLNPMYTADELKPLVEDTSLSTLITSDESLAAVWDLTGQADIPRVIITRISDFMPDGPVSAAPDMRSGWHSFMTLLDNSSSTRVPRVAVSSRDAAALQFTGGTTGVPKGALLTHGNLVAATLQCCLWGSATIRNIPPQQRFVLGVLPFFHIYGNVVVMAAALFNCATQILAHRFELDAVINMIQRFEHISFFPAVPTMISAVLNHPEAHKLNLSKRLGVLGSGAAPMPMELIEQLRDLGLFYTEGWGMSETSALGTSNPQLGLKKFGSIGIPVPDTDIKLVDVNDGVTEVKMGEPGEIVLKSPCVMRGYWNKPEETALQLKDGWVYTGDVAVYDEDYYFYIVDRKKDMIIAGGYNIYPREIDEVVYQHSKVQDAVCVGLPDSYRGETVKAYVVLKPGESATAEEIIGFCRTKLAAYKIPKQVEFRESLPKSAVGKILRKSLREEEMKKEAVEE